MRRIGKERMSEFRDECRKVTKILETCETVDKEFGIPTAEFRRRQKRLWATLEEEDVSVGIVFSDQHYNGDVPYLGGNTNITIEQVAGAIGPTGFHIIAGLEGGYIAEQLGPPRKGKSPQGGAFAACR